MFFNAKKARENYLNNKVKDENWLDKTLEKIKEASEKGCDRAVVFLGERKIGSDYYDDATNKAEQLEKLGFKVKINTDSDLFGSILGYVKTELIIRW